MRYKELSGIGGRLLTMLFFFLNLFMNFQALPGFRDFYPAECAVRDWLFDIWRSVSKEFGFTAFDGPPLESVELYKAKSGDEIVSQLYHFKDKGDREIALRPEMTPTLARMVGGRHRDFKKPIKWYTIAQVFRYERPQKGRLREHYQWNGDILGETGLGAEAELIALIAAAFKRMGLGPEDVVFRISDRMFWTDFLAKHQVPSEKHYGFLQVIDKIEREKPEVTNQKLEELGGKSLREDVHAVFEKGARSERLDTLLALLDAMGLSDWVQIDLKIARGFAYYTGIVFEAHDRQGELRALAGGGRYDHLIGHLTKADLPAIGFGFGDVAIVELLKAKDLMPTMPVQAELFVAISDESARKEALKVVCTLREEGYSVDYPLSEQKLNKQLEVADERGAKLILFADASIHTGRLAVKNRVSGTQVDLKIVQDKDRANRKIQFEPELKSLKAV